MTNFNIPVRFGTVEQVVPEKTVEQVITEFRKRRAMPDGWNHIATTEDGRTFVNGKEVKR